MLGAGGRDPGIASGGSGGRVDSGAARGIDQPGAGVAGGVGWVFLKENRGEEPVCDSEHGSRDSDRHGTSNRTVTLLF